MRSAAGIAYCAISLALCASSKPPICRCGDVVT
ncbi:hypothetical protein EH203_09010 [Pectobacterium carotovorum subsp. carotovorum]|nr:hypothetical protein EH203_09010 [Pectobacterium carotovorum subsp. carotovorum]RJL47367.1 hypothetical protein D5078_07165 [Pectobacterium carotovorum]ULS52358.1 hypothetical protein GBN63_18410 [Pectobacterium carotovorum]